MTIVPMAFLCRYHVRFSVRLSSYFPIGSLSFSQFSFLVKPHKEQKQLESFNEIHTVLMSGEEVRWAVNVSGCKCSPEPDDCGGDAFGDTIKGTSLLLIKYP
jgi:hypothetical protein